MVFRRRQLINKKKLACVFLSTIAAECSDDERKKRSVWTKAVNLRRRAQGYYNNLFLELSLEDPTRYRRCLRMDTETFSELLQLIKPLIEKEETHLRQTISAGERLALTLRHLATGESQQTLSDGFRIAQSTISGIIHEVCDALIIVLKEKFLKFPQTEVEWKVISDQFHERWNFPHCVGAMDGKHFLIIPPFKSGSLYRNYKETFSVVLLALVDANLKFIYVDVGTNGRVSDSGVWNKCSLRSKLDAKALNIPPPCMLPETTEKFGFVIVGDEGFALRDDVMIPYPAMQCRGNKEKRIFNYRLSRARRVSENAFGVLCAKFQLFRAPMRYDPDKATKIILACCALHNMLRSKTIGSLIYTPAETVDVEDVMSGTIQPGDWRNSGLGGTRPLVNQGGNRHRNSALLLRDKLCEYFNGPGAVPWQDKMI